MASFWEGASKGFNSGPDLFTLMRQKMTDQEAKRRTDLYERQVEKQEEAFEMEKAAKQTAENWEKASKLLGGAMAAHQEKKGGTRNQAILQLGTLIPDGRKWLKIGVTAQPGEDQIPTDIKTDNYVHMKDEAGKDIYLPWDDQEAEKWLKVGHGYLQGEQYYKDSMTKQVAAKEKNIESLDKPNILFDEKGNVAGYTITEHDPFEGPKQVQLTPAEYNARMGLSEKHTPLSQAVAKGAAKEAEQKGRAAEMSAEKAEIELEDTKTDPKRVINKYETERLKLADTLKGLKDQIAIEQDGEKKKELMAQHTQGIDRLKFLEQIGGLSEQLTPKELTEVNKSLRSMWAQMPDEQQASFTDFDEFFEKAFGELASYMRKEKSKSLLSTVLAVGKKTAEEEGGKPIKTNPMDYVTPRTLYPTKKKTTPPNVTLSNFMGR